MSAQHIEALANAFRSAAIAVERAAANHHCSSADRAKAVEKENAAKAALLAAYKQEWQPIESAPKDGVWALVYADGAMNCAYVKAGALPEDWCGTAAWNIYPDAVTHWMPLPAPPTPGSEK